jgi:hypothetical protein
VLESVAADLRRRTRELVGLPDGEEPELELVRGEGRLEESIMLIGTPQSLIAEGYRVCSSWVGGNTARFRRLLTVPLAPSDLVT